MLKQKKAAGAVWAASRRQRPPREADNILIVSPSEKKIEKIRSVTRLHLSRLVTWAEENDIDPRTVLSVLNWQAAGFIVHGSLGDAR